MIVALQLVDTGSLLGALGPFLLLGIGVAATWRAGTYRAIRELADQREKIAEAAKAERDLERERTAHALEENRALRRVNETLARRTDLGPLLEQHREFHREMLGQNGELIALVREMQNEARQTREQLAAHVEASTETAQAVTRALGAIATRLEL